MFNLSKEEWQLEIKSNKNISSLRSVPLPFPNLCSQLFEGATSTGVESWGPTPTLPRPTPVSQDYCFDNINDFDAMDCTEKETKIEHVGASEGSSAQSKKRKAKITPTSHYLEIGENISKVAKLMMDKYLGSDMDACTAKLDKLEWGKSDTK